MSKKKGSTLGLIARARQHRPAKRPNAWSEYCRANPDESREVIEIVAEFKAGNLSEQFPNSTALAKWLHENTNLNGVSAYTIQRWIQANEIT